MKGLRPRQCWCGGVWKIQGFACKAMQRRHAWLFLLKRRVFSGRFMWFFAGLRDLSAHENLTLFRRIFCPVVVSRCSVRPGTDGCQNVAIILCVINISSAGYMNGQRFANTGGRRSRARSLTISGCSLRCSNSGASASPLTCIKAWS